MGKRVLLAIAAFGSVLLPLARAAAASTPISFSEARDRILASNAGLRSAQTETAAARAGSAQAGTIPNPGIGVRMKDFGAHEIEVEIEQTIELGAKRKRRIEAARHAVDAAENARERASFALDAEIVRRFVGIAITRQKIAALDSILEITETIRDGIERRVDAGASRETDRIRIEIDIEQLRLERNELRGAHERARVRFAALGGEENAALMHVTGELDDDAPIPDLASLREAIEAGPALAAYAIDQARLDAEREALRAEAVPDLHLLAGVSHDRVENATAPVLGLSMSAPLFDRNAGARNRARLESEAVRQQRHNAARLLMADIRDIHGQLCIIDAKLHTLQTSVMPKVRRVYAMLQAYYHAGNAAWVDLAEARARMRRLELHIHDIRRNRALRLADLMQATGKQLPIVK
jgi:cobalt-zinc-cadmium efflux system outer membrane protein